MDNKLRFTTSDGKTVTIRTRNVGQSFGIVGELVSRNGRVIRSTPDTYPYGAEANAINAIRSLITDHSC